MFRNLFGGSASVDDKDAPNRFSKPGPRVPRHSSGWSVLVKELQRASGLRILDIGPTSPSTVNLLTELGQSVYLADLVKDANSSEFLLPQSEGNSAKSYDVQKFFSQNLEFHGREFDVVLLWDTIDYLPGPFVTPMLDRLHAAMTADAMLLAFFHTGQYGPETAFCRYHGTLGDVVEIQSGPIHPIQSVYSNRAIEQFFSRFKSTKFFLARDKLREVLVTR